MKYIANSREDRGAYWNSVYFGSAWSVIFNDENLRKIITSFNLSACNLPEWLDASDELALKMVVAVMRGDEPAYRSFGKAISTCTKKRKSINMLYVELVEGLKADDQTSISRFLSSWKKKCYKSTGFPNQFACLAIPIIASLAKYTPPREDNLVHILGGPEGWREIRGN